MRGDHYSINTHYRNKRSVFMELLTNKQTNNNNNNNNNKGDDENTDNNIDEKTIWKKR